MVTDKKKSRKRSGVEFLVIDIDLTSSPGMDVHILSLEIVGSEEEALAEAERMQAPLIISGKNLKIHEVETKSFLTDFTPEIDDDDEPEPAAEPEPEQPPAEQPPAEQPPAEQPAAEPAAAFEPDPTLDFEPYGATTSAPEGKPPEGKFAIKNRNAPHLWISDEGVYDSREKRLCYTSYTAAKLIADRTGGDVIDLTPEEPDDTSES